MTPCPTRRLLRPAPPLALMLGAVALAGGVPVGAQPSVTLPVPAPAPAPAPGPAPRVGADLPRGAIIAFMPDFGGGDYNDTAGLVRWLDARGYAICDGRNGTPDLRDRMPLGTDDPRRVGEALGSRDHDHRVRGDTGVPVRRNRATRTGQEQLAQLPDDQHRHAVDLTTSRADHLPPSLRLLFIMKLR